jgi:thiamine biosynthesis lipoprotein
MRKTLKYTLLFLLVSIRGFSQVDPMVVEGFAQGTTYHITYLDEKERFFKNEIDSILHDFDLSVSTYNPNSIISKINSNKKNVKLDKYFITCFKKAKEVYKNTNGTFDPTVYPLVNAWGFGPGKKEKIEPKIIDSILKFVGFNLIELKRDKIIKKDPRVSLDFNAFAQGYSVDVIAAFLNSKKIKSYVVEIGGEVFAKGKMLNGEKWNIGIEKPIDSKTKNNPDIMTIKLDGFAIATSGNYRKFTIEDNIKYSHHIDPKTGYPTKNNLLSVSVISKECITSDANATGVLVMGLEKAKEFLKKHKDLQAFLIYSDANGEYQFYKTPKLNKLLSEIK